MQGMWSMLLAYEDIFGKMEETGAEEKTAGKGMES